MKRIRRYFILRKIRKTLETLSNPSIAHFNRKSPWIRHLEDLQNQTRTFEQSDNDKISPIPRHDLSDFNKLTTVSDLSKNNPNPKMQDSPFQKYVTTSNGLGKYELLFTRIILKDKD